MFFAANPELQAAKAIPQPRRSGRVDELEGQVGRLLGQLRVAVVYAGNKEAERAVINRTNNPRPWKSYKPVAEDLADALRRVGCGHAEVMPEDMELGQRLRDQRIDFVWLNTGGVQGYCSVAHAAAMLEMMGVPYLGHDPLASALLDNKHTFKRQLKACGIPTAPFMTWHPGRGPLDVAGDDQFSESFRAWAGPFVVKPVSGRASLNVRFVENAADIPTVAAEVFWATRQQVLIEAFLPGREYCVAVAGPVIARAGRLERLDRPFAFAAVERVLDPGERIFTSMDVRPITTERVRRLDRDADSVALAQLGQLAHEVFIELGLESLVRLDVRADARGKLYVLEANPKPDLKAPTAEGTSLICAGLADYGMSYDDLVLSLLADRIDLLLREKRGVEGRLLSLLSR